MSVRFLSMIICVEVSMSIKFGKCYQKNKNRCLIFYCYPSLSFSIASSMGSFDSTEPKVPVPKVAQLKANRRWGKAELRSHFEQIVSKDGILHQPSLSVPASGRNRIYRKLLCCKLRFYRSFLFLLRGCSAFRAQVIFLWVSSSWFSPATHRGKLRNSLCSLRSVRPFPFPLPLPLLLPHESNANPAEFYIFSIMFTCQGAKATQSYFACDLRATFLSTGHGRKDIKINKRISCCTSFAWVNECVDALNTHSKTENFLFAS